MRINYLKLKEIKNRLERLQRQYILLKTCSAKDAIAMLKIKLQLHSS